ncbi:MAG: DUF4440 domain-containing protein [Candidatus Sericytochromatia bacterium]
MSKTITRTVDTKAFFKSYEKAFSDLNVQKQADLFADAFISAGPKGAIAQSKAEFVKMAAQMAEHYRSIGQESVKILALDETPISEQYALVKVHWGATFHKTGDRLIEFDVSYLLDKTGKEPKILLFIAHQDEEKAMRDLGIEQ